MGRITNLLLWRIIPIFILMIATILGWLFSYELPPGVLFATIIPLVKGYLPPTIIGHGYMVGTPEVPSDLMPQARPSKELFLKLPGGYKMPQVGIGMCCRPSAYDDVLVYRTVLWYLLLGGRHIDGAHLYLNHEAIGKGIAEAIRRGIKREEIFVTTKIFPTQFGYQSTLDNVHNYLKELNLEYIDLILLHFPSIPSIPGLSSPCKKEGHSSSACRLQTWKALSKLRNDGLIRNAGVSNFAVKHLKELNDENDTGLAPIANNQIQFNPFQPDHVFETMEYCAKHKITITAYSPLGGLLDKDKALVNEILTNISLRNNNKSISAIMLRWAVQRGCAVIPGTGNPDHITENLQGVYDFTLNNNDMKIINELNNNTKGFNHIDTRNIE